jgi:hypothetical protein
VKHAADLVHRQFQRVRRDLRANRLKSLTDRGGTDVNRDLAVRFEHQPRGFVRPRCAAFEVTANGAAAVAPLDQLALHG